MLKNPPETGAREINNFITRDQKEIDEDGLGLHKHKEDENWFQDSDDILICDTNNPTIDHSRSNEVLMGVANYTLNETKNKPCDEYSDAQRIIEMKDDGPSKRKKLDLDVVDSGEETRRKKIRVHHQNNEGKKKCRSI